MVAYREDLYFSVATVDVGRDEVEYILKSFIVDSGEVPTSGHYVTYIRDDNDLWRCIDDNQVF